jgi:hypothetical protein
MSGLQYSNITNRKNIPYLGSLLLPSAQAQVEKGLYLITVGKVYLP